MSELQLGLIIVGVLAVIAVYAFNRLQERQFRRRVEGAQQERPRDVLLESDAPAPPAEERIEPRLGGNPEAVMDEAAPEPSVRAGTSTTAGSAAPPAASPIDYVCTIEAPATLPPTRLAEFVKAVNAIGKPASVKGWSSAGDEWLSLPGGAGVEYARLEVSLQLADRTGPANRVQISTLRDLVNQLAEEADAVSLCPDIDAAAQAAAELDRFCARVDISLGCNVVPNAGSTFPGTKVRGLLESAGFVLESSGRFALRTEEGSLLLSAEDIEGQALSAERLRTAAIAGVTLTMDVPRVPATGRVFDRMIEIGRHLAQALDANVVDDNRAPLTEAGLKVIRQQLKSVHAEMEAQGIAAGGALAARLFS